MRLFGRPVVVVQDPSGEHLLIGDTALQVRLDIRRGSVLGGPVRLRYDLSGRASLAPKLITLQRLLALMRLGRVPRRLHESSATARRWSSALRVLDGRRAGASQRQIAEVLFGRARVEKDWDGASDYLRSRVQRLTRVGEQLVRGGYMRLLQ